MIFRVEHNTNYTTMCNRHLRDKRLSLKAKGLLSLMLSLPDEWDYSIKGLVAICAENQSAIESTLRELRATGYLVVTKFYPNETKTGRIEYLYDVHEFPVDEKQGVEKQGVENQGVEFQGVENRPQLNTKELNTKEELKNIKERECVGRLEPSVGLDTPDTYAEPPYEHPQKARSGFKKPTLEEVMAYCEERQNGVDAARWLNYYTANGWKVGKNPMKDWKAAVRTWERSTPKKERRSDLDDIF